MSTPRRTPSIPVVLAAFLLAASGAALGGAVTWSPHAEWPGRWLSLGPTGARGWVHGHRIHVVAVAPGSPARGVLAPHDVVVGAGGARFKEGEDPRVALGNAITDAETQPRGGRLALAVERDGAQRTLTLQLRVLGSYGRGWPFECAKSARILDEACAYLATMQYPDGHMQSELGMNTMWAGLLLLASGDAAWLDNARRAAYWLTAQDYAWVGLNAWPCGYGGLYVAEYYLATGDRTVLPWLAKNARTLTDGQMTCGSWGHSAPWGGYGAVNQVGLVCYIALLLTRECGLDVDAAALERSRGFFKKYAGKGWVPYGDHVPWRGPSGNGKNALAAVAFALLGSEPQAVRAFSRSVATSYAHRELGHTGSFFSFFWGPLAASHADRAEFRSFLDRQRWYYDLARTWQGGLTNQPNPENLSGRTPGTYSWDGAESTTGGMALLYALPRRTLRILGAEPSVFGRKLPPPLAKARALYEARKWDELAPCLAALPAEHKRMGQQLARAARRLRQSVTLSLGAFDRSIDEGDVYRASELLKGLERLLGKDRAELAAAQKSLAANDRWVEEGRKYHEAWSTLRDYGWQSWHYYGRHAKRILDDVDPPTLPHWHTLAATSEKAPQPWRMLQWGDVAAEPPQEDTPPAKLDGWQAIGFDDAAWTECTGPVQSRTGKGTPWNSRHVLLRRTFDLEEAACASLRLLLMSGRDCSAEVYLNGVLVARALAGPRRGYARIPLAPDAAGLLRKGRNLLAVHGRQDGKGQRALDVGLQAVRRR